MRNRDRDFSRGGGGGAPDRQQGGSGEYQRSGSRDRDFSRGGGGGAPDRQQGVERRGGGAGGGRMRIDYRDNNTHDNDEPREKPYGDYDGDHLYGVSPIKAALISDRRKVEELLVQEGMNLATKKDSKGAADILALAKKRGIPIREFPKHDLNMLSDNRPHQGFVLRASPLRFRRLEGSQALAAQPHGTVATAGAREEGGTTSTSSTRHKVVLALDEVWDPQNFGALLRTAHFLPGVAEVVVCAKNSAPLSETVSKASAGAMESVEVCSVDNMMKFLDNSVKEGWYVVGTSLGSDSMLMQDVPRDRPTILVLGNEGHGIRTNVLRRCTHLVRIDGGDATGAGEGVDSLNVSVTGGIMLHHLSSSSEHVT
jgi:21S rRNA (GM2251-2'-O)-methyltransferase